MAAVVKVVLAAVVAAAAANNHLPARKRCWSLAYKQLYKVQTCCARP